MTSNFSSFTSSCFFTSTFSSFTSSCFVWSFTAASAGATVAALSFADCFAVCFPFLGFLSALTSSAASTTAVFAGSVMIGLSLSCELDFSRANWRVCLDSITGWRVSAGVTDDEAFALSVGISVSTFAFSLELDFNLAKTGGWLATSFGTGSASSVLGSVSSGTEAFLGSTIAGLASSLFALFLPVACFAAFLGTSLVFSARTFDAVSLWTGTGHAAASLGAVSFLLRACFFCMGIWASSTISLGSSFSLLPRFLVLLRLIIFMYFYRIIYTYSFKLRTRVKKTKRYN